MIEREFTVVLKLKLKIDGTSPDDLKLIEILKESIYEELPYCYHTEANNRGNFAYSIFNNESEIVSFTSD